MVNHALIGVCVVVYALELILQRFNPGAFDSFMHAVTLSPGSSGVWTYFTYAFVHDPAGFMHILGNMLFLWVFGANVEDRFGRLGYLAFFLVASVAAGLLHAVFDGNPVIGASGGIAGVTGAYLVLFPKTHIRTLLFFFIIGIFNIPATWFIGFAIARDLFTQGLGLSDGVATLAHIGGYAFGIGLSIVLLATRRLDREPWDLFTIWKQAARRRQFKEASHATDSQIGKTLDAVEKDTPPDPLFIQRGAVLSLISQNQLEKAADEYQKLVDQITSIPDATEKQFSLLTLPRDAHIQLANHLMANGFHKQAAHAYERFLAVFPSDSQASSFWLMLGLLRTRYLNEPALALKHIDKARDMGLDDQHEELARILAGELSNAEA